MAKHVVYLVVSDGEVIAVFAARAAAQKAIREEDKTLRNDLGEGARTNWTIDKREVQG